MLHDHPALFIADACAGATIAELFADMPRIRRETPERAEVPRPAPRATIRQVRPRPMVRAARA